MNLFEPLLFIRLYDLNGDGCITRQEMLITISAVYEIMQGAQIIQPIIDSKVDRFFEKMDADKDGVVSREEFMSGCKNVRTYSMSYIIRNLTLKGLYLANKNFE